MRKRTRVQSSNRRRQSPDRTPNRQPNPVALTRQFVQQPDSVPQKVIAAQGVIGNQAVMRLVATDQPMLRWGSRGEAVERLQALLNDRNDAGLNVDGLFGPLTFQAVQAYQQAAELAVDGIVGPLTWGSLTSGGAEPPQPTPPDTDDSVGQQLVAALETIKAIIDGFTTASEGGQTSFAPGEPAAAHAGWADNAGDSSWGEAFDVVEEFAGDVIEQDAAIEEALNDPGGGDLQTAPTVTSKKSVADPKTAVPALYDEIKAAVQNLPAALQTGFQTTLQQMQTVADQIKKGTAPTEAMVTTFNQATADLLTVANTISVPASANGSATKIDLKKPTTWTITGTTIADVGQELDIRKSTHGEAAHVQRGEGKVDGIELDANGNIKKVQIEIPIDMELPQWPKADEVGKKCPCWKQEWDKFEAAITAHEQQHVAIYKLYFSNLHLRMLGKPEQAAFDLFDKTMEDAEKAQEAFDDATGHGVTGVPSTAFNAGRSCDGC